MPAARGRAQHPDPPATAGELARFPVRVVDGVWFRAHVDRGGRDRGCWWFASVGAKAEESGRFDLPAPHGSCYLASSAEAAARERVGTQLRTVHGRESVTAVALTTPSGPVAVTRVELSPTRAANLPVKAAQRWVDRSLSVGTGIYAVAQSWALAFHSAGLDGILYQPRFTGGPRVRALALFGRAGRPRPLRPVAGTRPLRVVLEECGVRVVEVPVSAPRVLAPGEPPPPL